MKAWTWASEDLSLAIRFLRALRSWTQARLAREAGTGKSRISLLESGTLTPDREEMQRFAAVVGFPFPLLEICLPLLRSFRLILPPESSAAKRLEDEARFTELVEAMTAKFTAVAHATGLRVVAELLLAEEEPHWSYRVEDRAEAEESYRVLESCSQEERLYVIEVGREYVNWALAERLCDASEKAAAAEDAAKALELAEAALKIASSLKGPEAWRAHVEGYCWGFLANARMAAGQPDEADEAYATARDLWKQWTPDPALLQESRLLKLGEALHGDVQSAGAGEG
jgi:transcriptional regulator with XRE-family HTH domain